MFSPTTAKGHPPLTPGLEAEAEEEGTADPSLTFQGPRSQEPRGVEL